MRKNAYAEKLCCFKQNEKPEGLLLVAENRQCINLVVAWTNTVVRRKRQLSKLRGESEGRVWDWLWENASYSRKELVVKSALAEDDFEKNLKKLIANRILYPDGTVNSFVLRYLRERVIKLLTARPKGEHRASLIKSRPASRAPTEGRPEGPGYGTELGHASGIA